MQERFTAEGFNQQHGDEAEHREAPIDPLGVTTPAKGRHISGRGRWSRHVIYGLAGGGHPAGSGSFEVIAGRRY